MWWYSLLREFERRSPRAQYGLLRAVPVVCGRVRLLRPGCFIWRRSRDQSPSPPGPGTTRGEKLLPTARMLLPVQLERPVPARQSVSQPVNNVLQKPGLQREVRSRLE